MFMCIELPLKEYLQKRFELSMSVPHNFGVKWLDDRMIELGYHLELNIEQDVHVHIDKHAYTGFKKNHEESLITSMLGKPQNLHNDVVSFILTEQDKPQLEKVTNFSNMFYNLLSDYHSGEESLVTVEIVGHEDISPKVIFSR